MKNSKFVLFPNTADASPRLIPEALIRDIPIVVNDKIYGGWKYVKESTGAMFSAPTIKEVNNGQISQKHIDSLKEAMTKVLGMNTSNVSKTYYSEYGFKNSCLRFAQIVNSACGTEYKAVCLAEWKKQLKKVAKNEGWI